MRGAVPRSMHRLRDRTGHIIWHKDSLRLDAGARRTTRVITPMVDGVSSQCSSMTPVTSCANHKSDPGNHESAIRKINPQPKGANAAPWESGKSRSADGVGRLVLAPRQIQSVVWRLLVSPLDGIQSRKSLRSKFFCKFRGGAGNRRHKNVDGLPSPCFLVRVYFESLDNTQSIPADGGAITSLVDVYRPLDPYFSSLNFLRWCVLDGPKVLPPST